MEIHVILERYKHLDFHFFYRKEEKMGKSLNGKELGKGIFQVVEEK
jgi:hypothetical protein